MIIVFVKNALKRPKGVLQLHMRNLHSILNVFAKMYNPQLTINDLLNRKGDNDVIHRQ